MKIIYILGMALFLTNSSYTQTKDSTYKFWLNAGSGLTNSPQNYSIQFNWGINYNFSFRDNYYQAGYQQIARTLGMQGNDLFYKDFILRAVNVGYGQITYGEFFYWGNFIGPSYVWGDKPSDEPDHSGRYNVDQFSTLGLALNSQIFFRPFTGFGIGLQLYGNWNPVRTMAEILLSVQIHNK